MAISVPIIGGASFSTQTPSLDNHFCVNFSGESDCYEIPGDVTSQDIHDRRFDPPQWSNPYVGYTRSVIYPYFPSHDTNLLTDCQQLFQKKCEEIATLYDSGAFFHLYRDALGRMYAHFNAKDLVSFSEVSKCCYVATKDKTCTVWEIQFKKYFPNVNPLSDKVCSFSSEQQFKIYFKRRSDELKPYIAQFKRNSDVIHHLKGSSGNDGAIVQAQKEYEALGGDMEKNKCIHLLNSISLESSIGETTWREVWDSKGGKANKVYKAYQSLQTKLKDLVGNGNFVGQLKLCENAIEVLVPKAFDDQEKFEEFIQRAEAAKNNSPENSG